MTQRQQSLASLINEEFQSAQKVHSTESGEKLPFPDSFYKKAVMSQSLMVSVAFELHFI